MRLVLLVRLMRLVRLVQLVQLVRLLQLMCLVRLCPGWTISALLLLDPHQRRPWGGGIQGGQRGWASRDPLHLPPFPPPLPLDLSALLLHHILCLSLLHLLTLPQCSQWGTGFSSSRGLETEMRGLPGQPMHMRQITSELQRCNIQ